MLIFLSFCVTSSVSLCFIFKEACLCLCELAQRCLSPQDVFDSFHSLDLCPHIIYSWLFFFALWFSVPVSTTLFLSKSLCVVNGALGYV